MKFYFLLFRTDAGVHALNSAVLVDLEQKNGRPYGCNYITSILNESFEQSGHQIRINQTEIVPNSFNERLNVVKSRTYLYRFGIIKPNVQANHKIEERGRCYFKYSLVNWIKSIRYNRIIKKKDESDILIFLKKTLSIELLNVTCSIFVFHFIIFSDKFDEESFRKAAQMLVGRHDYRTFMAMNSDSHLRPSFALREINFINVERIEGQTIEPSIENANIRYFNIIFNAQSFVYRQIRRMVGTLISVAENRLTHRDLYEMLTIPSKLSFPTRIFVVPSHGLYLADIEFRKKSFDP